MYGNKENSSPEKIRSSWLTSATTNFASEERAQSTRQPEAEEVFDQAIVATPMRSSRGDGHQAESGETLLDAIAAR